MCYVNPNYLENVGWETLKMRSDPDKDDLNHDLKIHEKSFRLSRDI